MRPIVRNDVVESFNTNGFIQTRKKIWITPPTGGDYLLLPANPQRRNLIIQIADAASIFIRCDGEKLVTTDLFALEVKGAQTWNMRQALGHVSPNSIYARRPSGSSDIFVHLIEII